MKEAPKAGAAAFGAIHAKKRGRARHEQSICQGSGRRAGLRGIAREAGFAAPNFVTRKGLAAIDAEAERLRAEYTAAQATDDRALLARVARDLRYWEARRLTAQLVPPAP